MTNNVMRLCHICNSYKDTKFYDILENYGNNKPVYIGQECQDCRNNRLKGIESRKELLFGK